jgi:hypothetical protein
MDRVVASVLIIVAVFLGIWAGVVVFTFLTTAQGLPA